MTGAQSSNMLALTHLITLSLWGGVVATEAVIEIYPFRMRDLHAATIRFHYWIDLLVELPLVLAVVATGSALLYLTDPVTPLHYAKIGFGAAAVAINLYCIGVVVRRGRQLDLQDDDRPLWRASRIVLACFAFGLLCAAGAAVLGFRFAFERLG
jgi:hypothetical protein